MKKFISFILAAVMLFSLTACGAKDEGAKDEAADAPTPTRDLNVYVVDDHPEDWSDPPEEEYYEEQPQGITLDDVIGYWTAADDLVLVEFSEDGTYSFYSPNKDREGYFVFTGDTVDVYVEGGEPSTWLTVVESHLEDASNIPYTKTSADNVSAIFNKIDAAKATPTPEPSAETVGYFKYNKIKKNSEAGVRIKFKNGASYAKTEDTGYYRLNPGVQVDYLDFCEDAGDGVGYVTFTLTYYFEDFGPKDFKGKEYRASAYYDLYDGFSGTLLSPLSTDTQLADRCYEYVTTLKQGDKTYKLDIIREYFSQWNTDGCNLITQSTFTVYFTKGYTGLYLVCYPSGKTREDYENRYPSTHATKLWDDTDVAKFKLKEMLIFEIL